MRTEVDDLIKLMEPIAASRGLALHEFFQMLLEMSPRELLGSGKDQPRRWRMS